MANKYTQIGHLGKSYGIDGFNRITIFEDFEELAHHEKFLFLEEEDYHVPYRIQNWKKGGKQIRFTDVLTQDSADKIQNKEIFLPTDIVSHLLSSPFYGIEGFTVYNGQELIGKIIDLQELPQQLMATVQYNEKEVFVPIHDSLVLSIDQDVKKIFMELPDGILEL